MNAIKNETQLWYSDKCVKTIKIKSKAKQFNSKKHIHKRNMVLLLKNMTLLDRKVVK